MSVVLSVKHLKKEYEKFKLDDISFEIESGTIMGLIGRNGAGKTTTIKSILNLIHISDGEIVYFGKNLRENEAEIKEQIGHAGGAVDYYKKKIKDIVDVTKTFYKGWDDASYRRYLELFEQEEDKMPAQLSEGMKVKLNLAIALSHGAKLLILDEPTSGLDPVSRDELLEIFRYLAKEGIAILFSTHITSDLDKCADAITYIQKKTDAVPYTNNAMMNANQFFLGGNLLVFALFNWLFVGGFFKTAYRYGKPFLFFSIASFVLIVIAETLHHIPGLAFLNKTDAMGDVGMWLFFAVTLLVYIFVTAMSCKTSMKRFEAVDM